MRSGGIMGKRSRKKRAKQKLLQKQRYFTHTTSERDVIEDLNNQESFTLHLESKFSQPKKEKSFLSHYTNQTTVAKSKKAFTYSTFCLVVLLGIIGLYRLATRPLPGIFVADLGNEHIPSATTPHSPYNSKPPTSGPHLDPKADWGIHNQQIPDELQLHNLEDGGVLIQYDCDGEDCADLVEKLKKIANKYREKVILAPYADLDQKIALTAWNRIDFLNEFDEKRIKSFIGSYRGIDHHKK